MTTNPFEKPRPELYNTEHYSSEQFPEIIGFCEKDLKTQVVQADEQSYQYKLHDQHIYTAKKKGDVWEIIAFEDHKVIRVSTGNKLGVALLHALTFVDADRDKQDVRANIIFPLQKANMEKAIALMYALGGYPANFLPTIPELGIIMERFIDPNIVFLAYSYVPVAYVPWLRDQLKNAGILSDGPNKTIWIYKK